MKTLRMAKQAFGAMAENKSRTFLMMLGVIIGVAVLTVITSSVMGARSSVMEKVEKFGVDQIMILAGAGRKPGVPQPVQTTLRVADAEAILSEVSNVKDTTPQLNRRDFPAKHGNKSIFGLLLSVMPNWASIWNTNVTAGRFISDDDVARLARVALLGPKAASDLFEGEDPVGKQIILNNNPFEIIGILEARGTSPTGLDLDSRVLIPLTTAQKRVFNQEYLSGIKVVLADQTEMSRTVEDIRSLLRERHNIPAGSEDDVTIVTPTQVMAVASSVSTTFNLFLVLISGIALVVGAIVIANIMFIAVNERKGEIGIRRAVGARKNDILLQFLVESVSIAALGGVIGIGLGLLGLKAAVFFMKIPTAVMWQAMPVALISSIIVGLLAGIQPARTAAALNPIEALK
ncbi:MAG: ABC transporter permease [Pseudomonadota bacterium]